jgi:hypothetical protein
MGMKISSGSGRIDQSDCRRHSLLDVPENRVIPGVTRLEEMQDTSRSLFYWRLVSVRFHPTHDTRAAKTSGLEESPMPQDRNFSTEK